MFVALRNLLLLTLCLFAISGHAWAVALGKINVTSHLGEQFFAEAPIQLDAGEKISDVAVELASPADYQILEVFRDPALNKLGVQVVNDLRGPRAVISSADAVDTPYFNLVLKLTYGHATNFKKYPVFLDLPEQVRPSAQPAPKAEVQPVTQPAAASTVNVEPITPATPETTAPAAPAKEGNQPTVEDKTGFHPYEGWARTNRYGPMVRGDTISTVARRLPVDQRYSTQQIMVGLFEKNRDKFREDNINLINAGTYLDVPTAQEIEAIPDSKAREILSAQARRWKELKQEPKYAAEAEAQANRYRTRVRIGEAASGTAAAPVQSPEAQVQAPARQPAAQGGESAAQSDQLRALQEENLKLKQALQASEAKAAAAAPETVDQAAADAQVKKLELTVARLQRQLKMMNQQMQEAQARNNDTLVYGMAGIIVLLIGVAGYLLFLLRRDRPHPAMQAAEPAGDQPSPVAPAAAAAAVSAVDEALGEDSGDDMNHEAFAASLDAEMQDETTGEAGGQDEDLLFTQKAPAAQAGIDYLAEAEVYLRYGMDDEALQQMNLAIEQKPDHLQAHTRLVQFLQSRGDEAALTAAIEAARSALTGKDLETFEAGLGGDEVAAAETTDGSQDEGLDLSGTGHDELADDLAGLDLDFGDMPADEAASDGEQPAAEPSTRTEDEMPESASAADDEPDAATLDMEGLDFDTTLMSDEDSTVEQAVEDVSEDASEAAAEALGENEAGAIDDDMADDGMEFVSSVEISPISDEPGDAETVEAGDEPSGSIETEDDLDLNEVLGAMGMDDAGEEGEEQSAEDAGSEEDGLNFDSPAATSGEPGEEGDEVVLSADDDDLGLDDILGEFNEAAESGDQESSGLDFADAAGEVTPFSQDEDAESVPETVIDSDSGDDELGLDDILGEFAREEGALEGDETGATAGDESVPETVIEDAADEDDLGLADILGEFESYENDQADTAQADTAQGEDATSSEFGDMADMPDMDVGDDIDDLLAEWGAEDAGLDFEANPDSLDVDRARSLLAEGNYDDAETALQGALNGERHADALIGLAEVAAHRGDMGRKNELLGEAESLLDDSNRDWFQQVQNLTA